jgi:hypothetical protein
MRYGDDLEPWRRSINHDERESAQLAITRAVQMGRPSIGRLHNLLQRRFQSRLEAACRSGAAP